MPVSILDVVEGVAVTSSRGSASTCTDRRRVRLSVGLVAAVAALLRVPFVTMPLGADEGGLLMLARQWHPGTSLYGNYWVDRPPLLVDVFWVSDLVGGAVGLRLVGLLVVAGSVVLAGRIGRATGGSSLPAALTAAAFLCTPLFGADEVDGELIAVPAVLAAILLALEATRAPTARRALGLGSLAGACAMAATMIKQNEIDGFVVLVVGGLTFLRRTTPRTSLVLVSSGLGATALAVALLLQSAALGTSPAGLWDAVVSFRLDAAQVIGTSATAATGARLGHLVLALLASGTPLVLLAAARRWRALRHSPAHDLRWATVALLGWELVSVTAGGSYWLHYLICLVPGLVLAVSLAATTSVGPAADLKAALTLVTTSTVVAAAVLFLDPTTARAEPVVTWLREHATPGQSGIVAYGHPNYLDATGLSSPYPDLWSLPVRVHDPALVELTRVLAGPTRPDWVVTGASGTLSGWGIDAATAQTVFAHHYRLVADLGDRRVYLDRSEQLGPTKETS